MNSTSPKKLRILHAPINIGNQPFGLSRAERNLGHESVVALLDQPRYGFRFDELIVPVGTPRLARPLVQIRYFITALRRFDVFHFYFAQTICFPVPIDLLLLKIARKRIVMTYQGCDIRRRNNCPAGRTLAHPPCHRLPDWVKQIRHLFFRVFIDHFFVLNPDLLDEVQAGLFLPYAHIEPAEIVPHFPHPSTTRDLTLLHAPTDRVIKGTDALLAAIEDLRASGAKLRLILVERATHAEVFKLLRTADCVIDQLRIGWYGGIAVEAMALGKPVICWIDPAFERRVQLGHLPFLSATEHTIKLVLQHILNNLSSLNELGVAGRRFVEKAHAPQHIAKYVLAQYAT